MRMLLKPCARTPSSSASVIRGLPQEVSSAPVASSELPRFQPGCIAATAAIAVPTGRVDGEVLGDAPAALALVAVATPSPATSTATVPASRPVRRRFLRTGPCKPIMMLLDPATHAIDQRRLSLDSKLCQLMMLDLEHRGQRSQPARPESAHLAGGDGPGEEVALAVLVAQAPQQVTLLLGLDALRHRGELQRGGHL